MSRRPFALLAAAAAAAAAVSTFVPRPAFAQCVFTGPTTDLFDSGGYLWDCDTNGQMNNGTIDAFDGGMALTVAGVYFPSSTTTTELAGRQVVHGPTLMSGLNVTRKAYVPTAEAWARFLEIFQNPTGGPITVTVRIETNAGSDCGTAITATYSGDLSFTAADHWLATDDFDGSGDPSLTHNYWGPGASLPPSSVGMTVFSCACSNGPFAEFSLTVPAGATRILMHFGAQNPSQATSSSTGSYLDGLPTSARFGLTATEEANIVNWNVCGPTDADGDGWSCSTGDCNDANAAVHPGALELCNGTDDDCSGAPLATETDADLDGVFACAGDCDDGDGTVYPGAPALCDGQDNDCDATTPDGEVDADGDGWVGCLECNDADASIHPGATELCNGVDDDCTGAPLATETDPDGDGIWACEGDCDPFDAAVYPGAPEICDDQDNDCDLALGADETDGDGDGAAVCEGDCDDADPAVYPGALEACDGLDGDCDGALPAGEADGDGDGVPACANDCDDADPSVHAGAVEACNGADDDCDGATPAGETDGDGDGVPLCADDCDDTDPLLHPGAVDIPYDGIDQDCDGRDLVDADMDGFAAVPFGGMDCDDTDPAISPAETERCGNGIDDDCDGNVDSAQSECAVRSCACRTAGGRAPAPIGLLMVVLCAATSWALRRRFRTPRARRP